MSSTHQQKLAKMVDQELGIGYQCSLEVIRCAAQANQLRYPFLGNAHHNLRTVLAIVNQPTNRKPNDMSDTKLPAHPTMENPQPAGRYDLIDSPDCVAGVFVRVYIDHSDVPNDPATRITGEINLDRIPAEYVESYEWQVQDALVKQIAATLDSWMVAQSADLSLYTWLQTTADGVSLDGYDRWTCDTDVEANRQRFSPRGMEHEDPVWRRGGPWAGSFVPFANDAGIVEFFVRVYRDVQGAPVVQRRQEHQWRAGDDRVARYNEPAVSTVASSLESWAQSMAGSVSVVLTGG